ncbi:MULTISPECIES: GlxA family transcriptional regulator [unclassified Halomonas]|uniref:GlxA family transcriptional regulator n=1 Tax=unclassified Halomonas TaxID=2609666 RepID=UPI001C96D7AC|nr:MULTISPECIES: GlxA family transcriptional regulator [unclassified Halomonas]MBY5924550.1 GlxA family transcriptional regulator [Halomonas sp. DP4Y7-2]MBY6231592.1 GlxA family transcriptional regulator [Halomonas sp. DP4Y7-1]MED5297283.1 GlxA family transcriptional regulator [Pseudomonadota bacterium]
MFPTDSSSPLSDSEAESEASTSVAQPPALSVGFVLLRRFTLLPFAAFVDCLRLASDEGDRSRQLRCRWRFLTADGEDAPSSCGAVISPCEPFATPFCDPRQFDYLVVIGGVLDGSPTDDPAASEYLRQAARLGVPLVGVCTGVLSLIQAGVMAGRRCCVSWYHHADLVRRFPQVNAVADRLYVDDGDRLTCAGGAAAADLAAYLVERHLGRAWARKSLNIMLLDGHRGGEHGQPQPVVFERIEDRIVRRAVTILEQHLGEVISVDELADRVGASRRGLERKFQDSFGIGPQKFARDLRLRYGLWLLYFTEHSITDIGERCGFADTAHFSRHFRAAYGQSPSQLRRDPKGREEAGVDPFFLHIGTRLGQG